MSQDPDPEDGDGAVVLPWVAPNLGDVSYREVGYILRVLDIGRLIEKGPGKTEMGLVAEVLLSRSLMEKTQAVAQVEPGHPLVDARLRSSWKEVWMASMKACESGNVL